MYNKPPNCRIFGKEISKNLINSKEINKKYMFNEDLKIQQINDLFKKKTNSLKYSNFFQLELPFTNYFDDKTKNYIINNNLFGSYYSQFVIGGILPFKQNYKNENKNLNDFLIDKDYFCEQLIDMKENEKMNTPFYYNNIFNLQEKAINEKNRGIIIQWLSYNNYKWKLNEETLFLAVNILDRYLSIKNIPVDKFQLLGLSSYFIATKCQDKEPPSLYDLLYSCKDIYSQQDVKAMEYEILSVLNFDILYISPYKFLTYFYHLGEFSNKKLFLLSFFILEICLLDIEIMKYSQGLRAIGALLVAKKCLQINNNINNIKFFYDYNEDVMKELQKKIRACKTYQEPQAHQ